MKYISFAGIAVVIIIGMWFIFGADTASAPQNESADPSDEELDSDTDASTLTMTDPKSGITFNYPEELSTTYITAAEWPPRFVNNGGSFNCAIDEQTAAMSGYASRTERYAGHEYCVWERTEGAAGSVYHDYQITYDKDEMTYVMTFTLQEVQCANFPEPEATECTEEQEGFELLSLVDPIAQSAHAVME